MKSLGVMSVGEEVRKQVLGAQDGLDIVVEHASAADTRCVTHRTSPCARTHIATPAC